MKKFSLLTIFLSLMIFSAGLSWADGNILGKWKMTVPAMNSAKEPCPFIPDSMEFFSDGTVGMSNMQGMKMLYRTDLTKAELEIQRKRYPDLAKKKIMLMTPPQQMDWSNAAMAYGYSVKGDELVLEISGGWTPAKFMRMK